MPAQHLTKDICLTREMLCGHSADISTSPGIYVCTMSALYPSSVFSSDCQVSTGYVLSYLSTDLIADLVRAAYTKLPVRCTDCRAGTGYLMRPTGACESDAAESSGEASRRVLKLITIEDIKNGMRYRE